VHEPRPREQRLEKNLADWKSFGAVSTPGEIVDLVIGLAAVKDFQGLDVLEPACGFCNFLIPIHHRHPHNRFYGVEINQEVYRQIGQGYDPMPFRLFKQDFLLWNTKQRFDLVIGNPPYGIIGDQKHYAIGFLKNKKEIYKRQFETWRGKYNIYGAFIEKGVRLLKPGGKLALITPGTWMVLDEFKALRKFLSRSGKSKVYYLGKKVFPGMSVSCAILVLEQGRSGVELFFHSSRGFERALSRPGWDGGILRFETEHTLNFEKGKTALADVFEVRISARSPELKSFPGLLSSGNSFALPFMNGRNVQKGIILRQSFTGLWLRPEDSSRLKAFYGVLPRIVVCHTKGGVIVSALEDQPYPYTGDVYHLIPKVRLDKKELQEIVRWLNSAAMESYMKTLYRDITPHTTATQLKLVPLELKSPVLV